MELNVSAEITGNKQNHSFVSNKNVSQALYVTNIHIPFSLMAVPTVCTLMHLVTQLL